MHRIVELDARIAEVLHAAVRGCDRHTAAGMSVGLPENIAFAANTIRCRINLSTHDSP